MVNLVSRMLAFIVAVGVVVVVVSADIDVEKRRPASYRNLNPRFRNNLLEMMMGDAPACEGRRCDDDGDCCSGDLCVAAGICVAHHGKAAKPAKALGTECSMAKADDCGTGLCCTTQKRFRSASRDVCLPCLD